MRLPLAGLLVLLVSTHALAQAEGEVESIGFSGYYRPNCWVPMRLKLRSRVGLPGNYKLQVIQEDMDRDRVSYTRPIALNPNVEGRPATQERYWACFLPQPRVDEAQTSQELTNLLPVFLCHGNSLRQFVQIPIPPSTTLLAGRNLDDRARGQRLVLVVVASGAMPILDQHVGAYGLTEDIAFIRMSVNDLPGNALAYQAVDGIIWLNADPTQLDDDTSAALQDYVREGGRLVVCQSPDWQKTKASGLAPLLPVTLESMDEEVDAKSLRRLAGIPDYERSQRQAGAIDQAWRAPDDSYPDPWADLQQRSTPIARATTRAGAMVDLWSASRPDSPYLARWMVGHGMVAWVAQDLGSPQVISQAPLRHIGWATIWDRCFDWPNQSLAEASLKAFPNQRERYRNFAQDKQGAYSVELSQTLLREMEHGKRGFAYVALVLLFFIVYWAIAGPGSYFFLLARKRSHHSWIAFAVCSLGATGVTAGLVKLILRGPPEVRHVSFVRVMAGDQTIIHSQFGLYVPRDDASLPIELTGASPKSLSYLTPYPMHEAFQQENASAITACLATEYEVPVRERTADEPPAIRVPYRSTSKRFQARWVGQYNGGIAGAAELHDNALSGTLINGSGTDLRSVYLVYRHPSFKDDVMFHLQEAGGGAWRKGADLDLAELASLPPVDDRLPSTSGMRGPLNLAWINIRWADSLRGNWGESALGDTDRAALLLSVFDRLAPSIDPDPGNSRNERYELLRRAGRHLDASHAISCGHLLIVARADNDAALPIPLRVDGESVQPHSRGTVYYQFIVPMRRSGSATRPSVAEPDPNDNPASRTEASTSR